MTISSQAIQEAADTIVTTLSNGGSLADAAATLSSNSNRDAAALVGAIAAVAGVVFGPSTGAGAFVNTLGIAAQVVSALTEFTDGDGGFTLDDIAAASGALGAILARNPSTIRPAGYFILLSLAPTFGRWLGNNAPLPSDFNNWWNAARNWIQRIDPLALDLNNNGIETISANGTVLFDHDGDGIKNGTGWLKPTDGWLVLDRNNNNLIDSGKELFGVDTVKSNGQKASDGFDALADNDTNQDNTIDALDSVFTNLRIWRDLNQDGVSQTEELTSLANNNILAIHLTTTNTNINLGNGNVQTAKGSFTRADGGESEARSRRDVLTQFRHDAENDLFFHKLAA